MSDCQVCFLLMHVVSLRIPADSQLAGATITTCGRRAGAEALSLLGRVWFHFQPLPLLPNWLCADEEGTGPRRGENVVGATRTACFGLPGCSPWFPMTFKKGHFLLVWAAASRQVRMGVGEEALEEEPLQLARWWPLCRCVLLEQ